MRLQSRRQRKGKNKQHRSNIKCNIKLLFNVRTSPGKGGRGGKGRSGSKGRGGAAGAGGGLNDIKAWFMCQTNVLITSSGGSDPPKKGGKKKPTPPPEDILSDDDPELEEDKDAQREPPSCGRGIYGYVKKLRYDGEE